MWNGQTIISVILNQPGFNQDLLKKINLNTEVRWQTVRKKNGGDQNIKTTSNTTILKILSVTDMLFIPGSKVCRIVKILLSANPPGNLYTLSVVRTLTYDLLYLLDLSVFGFCIVKNVPTNTGGLPQLINKVGFEKKTHYGTYFLVKSRTDEAHISNLAYTAAPLGLHLDLPYYDFVPGVRNKRYCK